MNPPPPADAETTNASPPRGLRHRVDAVARLLSGDDAAAVAADHGVPPAAVEAWAKAFCRAGETRLRQLPENAVERWLSHAEKLVPIATLLSVLIAGTLFVQQQRRESAERARAAAVEHESRVRDVYQSLDDRYLDYVKTCLDHTDLDVFDTPMANPPPATPERHRREAMVLSMLTSILERAYLMYGDPHDPFEQNQWTAWQAYTRSWAGRPNFRAEWANSRSQFDPTFTAYVDAQIQQAQPTTRP